MLLPPLRLLRLPLLAEPAEDTREDEDDEAGEEVGAVLAAAASLLPRRTGVQPAAAESWLLPHSQGGAWRAASQSLKRGAYSRLKPFCTMALSRSGQKNSAAKSRLSSIACSAVQQLAGGGGRSVCDPDGARPGPTGTRSGTAIMTGAWRLPYHATVTLIASSACAVITVCTAQSLARRVAAGTSSVHCLPRDGW